MDVQGSQYHLVNGLDDWGRCLDPASGLTLSAAWAVAGPAAATAWEYDASPGALRLRRDTPLFRRAGRSTPVEVDARRGAGRDTAGNWYWIDADRRTIRWSTAGSFGASTWWTVDDLVALCTCQDGDDAGRFTHAEPCPHADVVLQGLTVTTHQYLLAGYVDSGPDPSAGLLGFDLRGGGAPIRLEWPPGVPFDPWDLADTADGGTLVLDRTNSCYWRLGEHLRLPGTQSSRPALFQPADGSTTHTVPGPAIPTPLPLLDAYSQPIHPISIEPGPDGSVLVLAGDPDAGFSTLYRFDGDQRRWTTPLLDVVVVIDPQDPTDTPTLYSLLGGDFCYLAGAPATGPLTPPALYVADASGEQVVAFALDTETGALSPFDDFLPMRRWAGRGLVRAGEGVWYDFGERWIPLEVFTQCRFEAAATLVTPIDFAVTASGPGGSTAPLVGQPFDGLLPGCTWHRLFLDAQVPTGTGITVRARAADDPALLPLAPWLPQPGPYLRTGGPELPWIDVWADRRAGDGSLPDGTGTWELLFQQVKGRYLQVEIAVAGNGRSSPLLRSLRAWYPRFSYPEHYLPTVYAQNDSEDAFLERFLANPEGLYTALEERIEHAHLILDARTAPAADLPWLAAWFGLALDPLWDERRRRFLVRHVDAFYRRRGTISGLVALLRVFIDAVVDEGVFNAPSSMSASGVRVVEQFLTRDTGGPAHGAPGDSPDLSPGQRVRASAHRFDVLVPSTLSADDAAMVTRIVAAAKPAHAWFRLRPYDEVFAVGTARLGLDTGLGRGLSFTPMVPGRTALASGYLGFPAPFDVTDRVVSDRDRLGALPAL